MLSVIQNDPDILGGEAIFVGTRVPVKNLLDYLEAGEPISEFLEDFPSVTREQAMSVVRMAREALLTNAHTH